MSPFSKFWLITLTVFCMLVCANIYLKERSVNKAIDICTDQITKKLDIKCLNAIKKIYE